VGVRVINQTIDVLRNALGHLTSLLDGIKFSNATCAVGMQQCSLGTSWFTLLTTHVTPFTPRVLYEMKVHSFICVLYQTSTYCGGFFTGDIQTRIELLIVCYLSYCGQSNREYRVPPPSPLNFIAMPTYPSVLFCIYCFLCPISPIKAHKGPPTFNSFDPHPCLSCHTPCPHTQIRVLHIHVLPRQSGKGQIPLTRLSLKNPARPSGECTTYDPY